MGACLGPPVPRERRNRAGGLNSRPQSPGFLPCGARVSTVNRLSFSPVINPSQPFLAQGDSDSEAKPGAGSPEVPFRPESLC